MLRRLSLASCFAKYVVSLQAFETRKSSMSDFRIFFEIGLHHVLDIKGYDHILFLMALTVPYGFRDWRRVLLLVTVFTIGHTAALILSVFGILTIREGLVEFLIPCTILATALYSLVTAGKPARSRVAVTGIVTLFFGIVHGLGFSNYFKTILSGTPTEKMAPTLEFALGIEAAQAAVVLAVLLISYAFRNLLKFSQRDFALVFSAFIAGVTIPMLIENYIWK